MTHCSLHKGGILMLLPVRGKRVVAGFVILGVFALLAFGLIVLVKGTYLIFSHSVLPAQDSLDQFMDGDSELCFWR